MHLKKLKKQVMIGFLIAEHVKKYNILLNMNGMIITDTLLN